MREFLAAKKSIILIAVIALIALLFVGYFFASFGMCGSACNIAAGACNPISCVVDGCMGCSDCVSCMLGCD